MSTSEIEKISTDTAEEIAVRFLWVYYSTKGAGLRVGEHRTMKRTMDIIGYINVANYTWFVKEIIIKATVSRWDRQNEVLPPNIHSTTNDCGRIALLLIQHQVKNLTFGVVAKVIAELKKDGRYGASQEEITSFLLHYLFPAAVSQ